MIPRFIIGLIVAGATLSVASMIWPKFSASARPQPLEELHTIVANTPLGQRLEEVLGVTDEADVEQVNIASVASSLTQSALGTLEDRARFIIVSQAVRQLASQFNDLPQDQKQQVQDLICVPEGSIQQ